MKSLKYLFITLLTGGMILAGCEKDDNLFSEDQDILPESFAVNIPDAISQEETSKKSAAVEPLNGNAVYVPLVFFIHAGEEAAELVEEIILAINRYEINKPMVLTYTSEDDGRDKNLAVVENAEYEGVVWEFCLTISDADSEGNEDGGKGMQVFWNRNPLKGIALLKPYNIDREKDVNLPDAMFRIDYSQAGEYGYDAHMIVYITGLPLPSPLEDQFAMQRMKMFVGKKGEFVDVFGNSDHPNARFFAGPDGMNWAFAASGHDTENIGVAEVGLPPSNADLTSRDAILGYYSIRNTFQRRIYAAWPGIDSTEVEQYLEDTEAPGYFNQFGFVAGGESPGTEYDPLEARIQFLNPYNPKEIRNLEIEFKD